MEQGNTVTFSSLNSKRSLSPSDYVTVVENADQFVPLEKYIESVEKGSEIGSSEYVDDSEYYFLKAKSLNLERPLLDMEYSGVEMVRPQNFRPNKLDKGMILISKDSNVGDVAFVLNGREDCMLSSAIHGLKLNQNPYYVFAWLNSSFFERQILSKIPRGSTIAHAKEKYRECMIPEWTGSKEQRRLADLQEKQIRLHQRIEDLNQELFELFEQHFQEESGDLSGSIKTTYEDLKSEGRLDTSLYTRDFIQRRKLITNYSHGCSSIYEQEYDVSRGQNLQESTIGKSIYSDERKPGYYRLLLPTVITRFGTVSKIEWLGNSNDLDQLEHLDIVIGAEGYGKGRSTVVLSPEKTVTNIHGIVLQAEGNQEVEDITTIRCYLNYLRDVGLIDIFAVGGNGGSLAVKYWKNIPFPNFTQEFKQQVKEKYLSKADTREVTLTDDISELGIKDLDILDKKISKELDRLRRKAIEQ